MNGEHSNVFLMVQPSNLIALSSIALNSISDSLSFQNYPVCPSRALWRRATESENSLWPATGPPLHEQWGTERCYWCLKHGMLSLDDTSFPHPKFCTLKFNCQFFPLIWTTAESLCSRGKHASADKTARSVYCTDISILLPCTGIVW